jgi:IS605 OrfB family transposase
MYKCLKLVFLELTNIKRKLVKETYHTFLAIATEALPIVNGVKNRKELHKQTYYKFKEKYTTASQLIIEAISYAWSHRKTLVNKPKKCIIRFDQRLFSFKNTNRGNPVLSLRLNHQRIGIPLMKNGCYLRLQAHFQKGWLCTSVIMKQDQTLLVLLKKTFPDPLIRPNSVGIDLNSSNISLTVIDPNNRILKQTYWAKGLSTRQYKFEKRRASLQYYQKRGPARSKAGLKLKRLSGKQQDYIQTNLWQIANEVVKFAKNYQANIVIEKLSHLRIRKGHWNRISRKKTNRIPYRLFRHTITHVAEQEGVLIEEVNPHYSSQRCPACSYTHKSNWVEYSYFRCKKCGYEAHRDRIASLNIAKRANKRFLKHIQISPLGSAVVNQRDWQDEKGSLAA